MAASITCGLYPGLQTNLPLVAGGCPQLTSTYAVEGSDLRLPKVCKDCRKWFGR